MENSNHDETQRVITRIVSIVGERRKNVNLDVNSRVKDFLDSLNMVRLVTALEDEFKISFGSSDLDEANWATPKAISGLIGTKRNLDNVG